MVPQGRGRWLVLVIVFLVFLTTLQISTRKSRPEGEGLYISESNITVVDPPKKNEHPPKKEQIHLIFPVDKHSKRFCRTLFSALVNGYPAPNVYNWGEHFASASEGQGKKINGFMPLLDSLDNNSIAVYSDALDVIFQLPLDVLLLRYKETQKNLVIGAEKNCFPEQHFCDKMPQSNLPSNIFGSETDKKDIYRRPRWLNSGIMIGQTDHLKTLFTLTKAKWDTLIPPPLSGDQGVIAEMFYFNYELNNWALDYESTMFQMMYWSTDDIVWDSVINESTLANAPLAPSQFKKKIDVRGIDLNSTAGRLGWNRISNTIPAAMHFNSEEQKINLDAWWTKAWWYPRLSEILEGYANDENVGMHVNGQWMTWNETCGSYDLR